MTAWKYRSIAALLSISSLAGVAYAQKAEEKKPTAPAAAQGQPEMSAEEKAWMEAAMPGPNHELLKYCEGKWTTTNKMWMSPEAEPAVSTGTAETTAILGGRYFREVYKSEFGGMAFEGFGISGYDNISKKFIGSWIDNMSTGIMSHEGAYDAGTKTFTYNGEFMDPMGKKVKSRMTVKVVSNDEHLMTMYHTMPGEKEKKVMEIEYKRAAQSAAAPAKSSSGS